jgi:PP-loop superfamily ATP-utilizing enzyme
MSNTSNIVSLNEIISLESFCHDCLSKINIDTNIEKLFQNESFCYFCQNHINSEIIRHKVKNISTVIHEEKIPNIENLERYCPPNWDFLWK